MRCLLVTNQPRLSSGKLTVEILGGEPIYAPLDEELRAPSVDSALVRLTLGVAVAEAHGCSDIEFAVDSRSADELGGEAGFEVLEQIIKCGTKMGLEARFRCDAASPSLIAERPSSKPSGHHRLALFSGGLDCRLAIEMCRQAGDSVTALFVDYGQSNLPEENACVAETVRQWRSGYDMELGVRSIALSEFYGSLDFASGLLRSGEPLTMSNAAREYVPFRNSVFLALAIEQATRQGIPSIVTGSNAGDRTSPDNSAEYYRLWNAWLSLIGNESPRIDPVLLEVGNKTDVVAMAVRLGFDLSSTWTCHNGSPKESERTQCGTCAECLARASAFAAVGANDPVPTLGDRDSADPVGRDDLAGDSEQRPFLSVVLEIISEVVGFTIVDPDLHLGEAGVSSLKLVETVVTLEERLGVIVPDDAIVDGDFDTPRAICRIVAGNAS